MLLRQKCAFTLAEVLIVLSIIGIVAAMTIPNLMTKIQDMEFKTAAKKAYSVTSEAIKKMNYDNETTNSDYINHGHTFKPELIKYLRLLKDCGLNSCPYRDTYNTLSGLNSQNIDTTLFDDGQFLTTDGYYYMVENWGSPIFITVDVNGYNKKPNVLGRDVFVFQLLKNSLVPMGADGTAYPSSTYCNRKNNIKNQGMGCMYYVMQGINY